MDNSSPYSSLAKVKYLIHGGAPSSKEVEQVVISPLSGSPKLNRRQLKMLITKWVESPEGSKKIKDFLSLTLQQNDWILLNNKILGRFRRQGLKGNNNKFRDKWESNIKESFARTALDIIIKNKPFTNIITTKKHAVTSALLSTLSFVDEVDASTFSNDKDFILNDFVNNSMRDSDFSDWHFVNIKPGSAINYKNLSQIRQIKDGETYSLRLPRIGFFNTLGFQLQNPSTVDNDFRVTINQTLIASLNETFEASDPTEHGDLSALDNQHAKIGTSCYECHKLMDPMKESFKFHYDAFYRYSDGEDKLTSDFAFKGYKKNISTVPDLANVISEHPLFAQSWTSKLCNYVNSKPCDEKSREFIRLSNNFRDSNYNFKALLVELLSSPITTGKGGGEEANALISFTRRNHLCHSLNIRYRQILERENKTYALSNDDICSIKNVLSVVTIIPTDTTPRGATGITSSAGTSPFITKAQESLCQNLAKEFVGSEPKNAIQVDNPERSFNNITEIIMGLPKNHPRHDQAKHALQQIYQYGSDVLKISNLDALRESFVFACTSPDAIGIGL